MIYHKYKMVKGQWGIFIDIYGTVYDKWNCNVVADNAEYVKIDDRIDVLFAPEKICGYEYTYLHKEDYPFMVQGIKKVSDFIQEYSPYRNTLIVFYETIYNECDFQEEGLTAGVMEWAAKAFGFKCPEIDVNFHKADNQYIYNFNRENE